MSCQCRFRHRRQQEQEIPEAQLRNALPARVIEHTMIRRTRGSKANASFPTSILKCGSARHAGRGQTQTRTRTRWCPANAVKEQALASDGEIPLSQAQQHRAGLHDRPYPGREVQRQLQLQRQRQCQTTYDQVLQHQTPTRKRCNCQRQVQQDLNESYRGTETRRYCHVLLKAPALRCEIQPSSQQYSMKMPTRQSNQ